MTDFPNPVFSPRRAALLAHVPARATVVDGASSFSEEMGDAIAAAAPATPEGSPEREFAARWDQGEDIDVFAGELQTYYDAVTARLRTQAGLRRLRPPGRVPPRPGPAHADLREPSAVRPHRCPLEGPRDARRRNRRGGLSHAGPAEIRHPGPAARAQRRRPRGVDQRVGAHRRRARPAEFPQFFDPTATDVGADVMVPAVSWIAFPATLLEGATSAGAAVGGRGRLPHACRTSTASGGSSATATACSPGSPSPRRCPSTSSTSRSATRTGCWRPTTSWWGRTSKAEELVVGGRYRRDNVHNDSTAGPAGAPDAGDEQPRRRRRPGRPGDRPAARRRRRAGDQRHGSGALRPAGRAPPQQRPPDRRRRQRRRRDGRRDLPAGPARALSRPAAHRRPGTAGRRRPGRVLDDRAGHAAAHAAGQLLRARGARVPGRGHHRRRAARSSSARSSPTASSSG